MQKEGIRLGDRQGLLLVEAARRSLIVYVVNYTFMKIILLSSGLLLSLLSLLAGNRYYPRDPNGTLKNVRHGLLRVGYTNAAPWVVPARGGPQGIEPTLVRAFAQSLGARLEWVPGTEQHLYEALAQHQLDLLIAGITDESPWKEQVALTRSYLEASVFVGAAPGRPAPSAVKNQSVAVGASTDLGHYVARQGGVPVPALQLPGQAALVAGYDWQLRSWGYRPLGHHLKQEKHVMAVPPGENAWLVALEMYLYQHRGLLYQELR